MKNLKFDLNETLQSLKTLGIHFAAKFRQQSIPKTDGTMLALFREIEEESLSILQRELATDIPFAGDEFDFERSGDVPALPTFWLFDSMDGAVQYMRHLPGWSFNLTLVVNGELHFSAIYDPLHDELFWAEHGRGAFLNGVKINAQPRAQTPIMMAGTSHPPFPNKTSGLVGRVAARDEELLETFSFLRNFGPTALQMAYVAAGRLDIFAQEGPDTFNWLPGVLIAREAGANVVTSTGEMWVWGSESLVVAESSVIAYLAPTEGSRDFRSKRKNVDPSSNENV